MLFIIFIALPGMWQAQDFSGVTLLANWDNDSLPLNFRDSRYSDCWGFVHNGEEYGVLASTLGAHIIHIAEDNTLEESAYIPSPLQGFLANHRDYKTYGNHLYIVSDEPPSTLQIVDYSYLPDSVVLVYDSNEFFSTCHNLFVDETAGILYACGTSTSGLSLYDIATNPAQPQLITHFDTQNYTHDMFIREDTAFLHRGFDGMMVVNFADPVNPEVLGTLTEYPEQGYNHSGWLDASGQYYVMADETPGLDLKMLDVSDLTDIQVTDVFNSQESDVIYPHNAMIRDGLIFTSYYVEGLEVFDFSDPANVERVAWYDTSPVPDADSLAHYGAWGVYPFLPSGKILISDRQEGLFVFGMDNYDLSVSEHQQLTPQVTLYPNPASTEVRIRAACSILGVEGYSAQGKCLFSQASSAWEERGENQGILHLDGCPEGMIMLRIHTTCGMQTHTCIHLQR